MAISVTGAPAMGASSGERLSTKHTTITDGSLQVSSSSASATNVVDTVTFAVSAALGGGVSTITLNAPSGTVLPGDSGCAYTVTDDGTGSAGCASALVSGAQAIITSPVPARAGDLLSVEVNGVSNPPAAGGGSFSVTTSAGGSLVLDAELSPTRAVARTVLSLSSVSAAATEVTYSLTFRSPDRLSAGLSMITVSAPTGTLFPQGCTAYDLLDNSLGSQQDCNSAFSSGSTVSIVAGETTSPGDLLTVLIHGVTNPSVAASESLELATTSDPAPVTLDYQLTAEQAVTNPYLKLSSYTASATRVRWSVGFASPERLSSGYSTITLTAPAGTVFPTPACGDYTIIDSSKWALDDNDCPATTVSGTAVTITVPFTTNPNDMIFVVVTGVTNPTTVSPLTVDTSSDPAPVTIDLDRASTPNARFVLSSASAGATDVTYSATFVSNQSLTASSTVTLTGPRTTMFPTCAGGVYFLVDDTTGAEHRSCSSSSGSSITFTTGLPVAQGDAITLYAFGVTNSSTSGSRRFTASTSGGSTASFSSLLSVPPAVTSASLQLSSVSASALDVDYAVTFTSTNGLTPQYSTITLAGPAGTQFSNADSSFDSYDVVNDTTGLSASGSGAPEGSEVVITPGTGDGFFAAPGDEITVSAFLTTNSSSSGNDILAVTTGSDPKEVAVPFSLTPTTSVSGPDVVRLSIHATSTTHVTYSLTFVTTNSLTDTGAIELVFPSGTGVPSDGTWSVIDDTSGLGGNAVATVAGTAVIVTPASEMGATAAGDVITVLGTGLTNPSSAGATSLQVATTADPAPVSVEYSLR